MKLNPEYYFYDSKLAVSPAELQDLYRFTRWYADEARTTIFDFKIPITESITLYAGWSYINPDVPAEVEEPEIGTWTPVEGNPEDVEL